MKLLTKTTIYFLLAMVPLLAAGGFYLFHQFSNELNKKTDEELIYEELKWIHYLKTEASNGTAFILKTPDLIIYPVDELVTPFPEIKDIIGYDENNKTKIAYRELSHVVNIYDNPYQIIIRKSQQQKTVMVKNVTWLMLFVFAGLFLVTLVFNWIISNHLWKPFKTSLEKIRKAELHKMEAIHFEKTNTTEFNELNTSLNYMTGKIYNDYLNMKEFTENAAHEMQTPLAVAQSRMELLLQDTNLTDDQVESIMQAGSAINRLGKLNQSLLFLAKIDNTQYDNAETINITTVIKKYLQFFDEIIKDKQLHVETVFQNDLLVKLHPLLAESFISNLIGNAVKYNFSGGEIIIKSSKNTFSVSNSSNLPAISASQLYQRFNKAKDPMESSTGLGLAIVKKIADTNQLKIDYTAANGNHQFTITKN